MEVYRALGGNMKEGWSLLPVEVGVKVGGSRKYSVDRCYFSCKWWANICQEPGRLRSVEGELGRGSKEETVQATRRHGVGNAARCVVYGDHSVWLDHALKGQGKRDTQRRGREKWAEARTWISWKITEFEFYSLFPMPLKDVNQGCSVIPNKAFCSGCVL